MKALHVKLEACNLAQVEVIAASERAVCVKIEATDRWDAEGLLALSQALKGVAGMLLAV